MRSVNKVILVGNLTRDPELKQTTSGQSIVTFGLATNRQWVTSGGDRKDSAEFHECVAWAKLAEICQKYLKKGMLVYVEGYLKTRSWDLEDGTRRFRTEIVLQDMIMLEKKGADEDYFPTGEEGMVMEPDGLENVTVAQTSTTTSEQPAQAPSEESAEETPVVTEPTTSENVPGSLSADIDDDNMF